MTWPPGDPRRHWSPLFDFYGRLVAQGHELNMPDRSTQHHAQTWANEPRKILTGPEMRLVADRIGQQVQPSERDARLRVHAAAIETTHVHLLFDPVGEPIGKLVGRLKGTTSSAVLALSDNQDRRRTWTTGYWKVFLSDDGAVTAVRDYIEQHNLRRDMPGAPFDWITCR